MTIRQGQSTETAPSSSNYTVIRVGSISGFASNCKRMRYRKSDCRQCLDVCPEDAISLNPGPGISKACTECGLCVAACPTEVFRDENRREQILWHQAVSLQALPSTKPKRRALNISCHKVAQPDKDFLPIDCLGNLTVHFVMALAFLGYEELTFSRGACSECHLKEGERLLLNSVRTAGTLLDGTRYAGFVVHLRQGSGEVLRFNRRRLFSPVATAFRSMHHDTIIGSPVDGASVASGRKLLRHLLEVKHPLDLPRLKYSPDLPWGKIAIDEKLCTGCGICTAVCPTGAIAEDLGVVHKILRFNPSVCVNCRLCSEACTRNAVKFEEDFTLADVLLDVDRVVARIEMPECLLCGDRTWAGLGELCPTCEKRQLNQTYAPQRSNPAECAAGRLAT